LNLSQQQSLNNNNSNYCTTLCQRAFGAAALFHRLQMSIRVLNIAEKPSVAREIAAALSGMQPAPQHHGQFSRPHAVFEFPFVIPPGGPLHGPVTMVVSSVRGHLLGLEFKAPFNKWGSCNPVELFSVPTERVPGEGMQELCDQLGGLARTCQWVVLWLDCDREGEAIGFEVKLVCEAAKKHLRFLRARFSTVAHSDLLRAVASLGPPDERQSEAVLAREEIDLRLGSAFTRLQTKAIAGRFEELIGKIM